MTEPEQKRRTEWRPVDRVALAMALGLALLGNLIIIATVIQIIDHQTPEITLSENATQIIITIAGGMTGLIGAYIGINRNSKSHRNDQDKDSSV
jgi:hypothetical protein